MLAPSGPRLARPYRTLPSTLKARARTDVPSRRTARTERSNCATREGGRHARRGYAEETDGQRRQDETLGGSTAARGDFTHPAGFLVPEKAGPFEREEVIQYDQLGRDLSAGYDAVVGKGTPLPARMRAIVDLTESLLPPEAEPTEPGRPPERDRDAERLARAAEPEQEAS